VPGVLRTQRRFRLAALKARAIRDGTTSWSPDRRCGRASRATPTGGMLLVRTDPTRPNTRASPFCSSTCAARDHRAAVEADQRRRGLQRSVFEDVRVPRRNVIGEVNGGWEIAITTLMHERATLTFSRQLQSRVALSDMIALARRWQCNGRRACDDPLMRQQLAQALIESDVIKYTAYRSLTKTLRVGFPAPRGQSRNFSGARCINACSTAHCPCRVRTPNSSRGRVRSGQRPVAPPDALLARPHDRRRQLGDPAQHRRRARPRLPANSAAVANN